MTKMSPEALYRTVSEPLPSTARSLDENLQLIRWAMKLVELADEIGAPAVRKALDRHASALASDAEKGGQDA